MLWASSGLFILWAVMGAARMTRARVLTVKQKDEP